MDKQGISENNLSDKKKRGRKKNVIVENVNANTNTNTDTTQNVVISETIKEKKQRKKRTKKGESANKSVIDIDSGSTNEIIKTEGSNEIIKKRKRRTRKDIENMENTQKMNNEGSNNSNNSNENEILSDCENTTNNQANDMEPKEEKVAKKRGRKPKGGKITIQPQTNNNIQNELPNIILHLKCSLSDLTKNNSEVTETYDIKNSSTNLSSSNVNNIFNSNFNSSINTSVEPIQSYNSMNVIGSEINSSVAHDSMVSIGANNSLYNRDLLKKTQHISNVHDMITKDDIHGHGHGSNLNTLNETYSSAMFPVYDPCIPNDMNTHSLPPPIPCNMPYYDGSNQIINKNPASLFSTIYSPDIVSYNNPSIPTQDDDSSNPANLNERDIWKKINQLKLSFHKSDICQNIRGAQRSACFWCTCEFDSPAIYIPKSVLKDMYNVYGCFCSPECAAAFLMNESIDTSTKFERYHLLNSLYGKIYKYEKSIKIAPNPYYLLNKFYGTLTIQEYRKLFQSDQMIYVVNKPLTHILPELYEDNNDFLLNNKIIPTNSMNLKKKVLKSNV